MRYPTRRKIGSCLGAAWLILAVVPVAFAQYDGSGGAATAMQPPDEEPPGDLDAGQSVTIQPPREDPPSWEEAMQPAEADEGTGDASERPEPDEEIEPAWEEAAQEAKPLRGPKFLNLRYDEDFSYLDGPEDSYKKDFFDPIKWLHLTDDLTLTIGGEFRARLEAETNRGFGSTEPAQDTFLLHRYRYHFDLRYRKLVRVFYEGISAYIEDRDLRLLGIHENRWDHHQLFADFRVLGEQTPLVLRVGRQELLYGKQRLISPLGWANTRRRFDGVKLFYKGEKFNIDAFYVRPVPVNVAEGYNRKPDEYREESHFFGLYTTWKAIPNHVIDLYFLALRDTGDLTNSNGRVGDMSLYTMGGRIGGKCGNLDYDGELAGQWGKFAGDTIHAWMAGAEAGYTFSGVAWKPRIGIGFDYGSGDKDPNDSTHDTFNQLFPLGHAYLGYLDLFGRQNVLATNVNITAKPCKKVTARLAWQTFWSDSKRDAMYNAGGGRGRRNVFGNVGHDIGNELDLTIKYAVNAHQSVLFGYSHFWGNNFVRATGPSKDADLIYVQYAFRF